MWPGDAKSYTKSREVVTANREQKYIANVWASPHSRQAGYVLDHTAAVPGSITGQNLVLNCGKGAPNNHGRRIWR